MARLVPRARGEQGGRTRRTRPRSLHTPKLFDDTAMTLLGTLAVGEIERRDALTAR